MVKHHIQSNRQKNIILIAFVALTSLTVAFTIGYYFYNESKDSQIESTGSTDRSEPTYIGLSEQAGRQKAANAALAFRVVSVDGEGLFHTFDYNPDRINVSLEKGNIVKAERY